MAIHALSQSPNRLDRPSIVFSAFSTGKSFHMSYMTRKRIVGFTGLGATLRPQPRRVYYMGRRSEGWMHLQLATMRAKGMIGI